MGTTSTTGTFADKFEEALRDLREREPGYGLRTLARKLAKDDPKLTETIRRRLNKYRPKPSGGAAEVAPTASTRQEIEDAMGLERDALKPDPIDAVAAQGASLVGDLLGRFIDERIQAANVRAAQSNDQVAHLRGERDLVATTGGYTRDRDPDE